MIKLDTEVNSSYKDKCLCLREWSLAFRSMELLTFTGVVASILMDACAGTA